MDGLNTEMCRSLLEVASDALLLVDSEGTILYASPRSHTLFGFAADALTGVSIDQLLPAGWPTRTSNEAGRIHDDNAAFVDWSASLLARRADGSRFRAEIGVRRMRNSGVAGFAIALRDATESAQPSKAIATKQWKQQIHEAQSRLQRSGNRSVGHALHALLTIAEALKCTAHVPIAAEIAEDEQRLLAASAELLHTLSEATVTSPGAEPESPAVLTHLIESLRQDLLGIAKLKALDVSTTIVDIQMRAEAGSKLEKLQRMLARVPGPKRSATFFQFPRPDAPPQQPHIV